MGLIESGTVFGAAVIGAGAFGAWTAYELRRSGRTVALLDGYGAANSRSSSGGESRIIRMGYGPDEIYTRMARQSLDLWRQFSRRTGRSVFEPCGVLWLAHPDDRYLQQTEQVLQLLGIRHVRLEASDLRQQYPQIDPAGLEWGLLEPDAGALMARQAVRAVVHEAIKLGTSYRAEAVRPPEPGGVLQSIVTTTGTRVFAETFVFACGAWLPKVFPSLLGERIHATRQEVFFFGPPSSDHRFSPPHLPAWIDFGEEVYGVPDLERRGFKIAFDTHGDAFDPDTGHRIVSDAAIRKARELLARRFPALADAPLLETRVCQYENTSSGDFLIDRHPDFENVWLVGGGSGHGFKHAPAVARHVIRGIEGEELKEPRFWLATKDTVQQRLVF